MLQWRSTGRCAVACAVAIIPRAGFHGDGEQEPLVAVGYSTVLGGAGVDDCDAVAVDGSGAVYLGCHSDSPDLPGPDSSHYAIRGDLDAFVLKLAPDGRRVVYRTPIGGAAWEAVTGIAVDAEGYAYAVGATYSTDLPTTAGAAQPRHGAGEDDAFVARLDPAGTVVYLTYLGGSGRDDATSVTVDGAGNAYVVGRTASREFRASPDALQRVPSGGLAVSSAGPAPPLRLLPPSAHRGGVRPAGRQPGLRSLRLCRDHPGPRRWRGTGVQRGPGIRYGPRHVRRLGRGAHPAPAGRRRAGRAHHGAWCVKAA